MTKLRLSHADVWFGLARRPCRLHSADIGGALVFRNEFRLVAAVHFDAQRVFTLRFFTHAHYEKTNWKEEL